MPKPDSKVVREINKDKFKKMFLNGYNPESEESIPIQFEKIENSIIKYIGNADFIERYKNAIITFGDWFVEEFEAKELEDFYEMDFNFDMPLILIIYFDLIKDNIYSSEYGKWDEYIDMFKNGLKNNIESKVAQLTYINVYFSQREEQADFMQKNIEPLAIFFKWFSVKQLNEELVQAIADNWMGDVPYIFEAVEEYLNIGEDDGLDLSDEEAHALLDDLESQYKKLSFSEKKNVDSLVEWICDIQADKYITICPLNEPPMEPIPFPEDFNEDNKEVEEPYQFLIKILKGYASCLYEDEGVMIVSHIVDDHTQCFSGFLFMGGEIHAMEAEELSVSLSVTISENITVIFDTPDVVFIN